MGRISLETYLKSTAGLPLPEPHSDVTRAFTKFVATAHSWYKLQVFYGGNIAFHFYVDNGPLVEFRNGKQVYDEFQYLKYGVAGHMLFSAGSRLPRAIADAGLSIVRGDLQTEETQYAMQCNIANMIDAIKEYRQSYDIKNIEQPPLAPVIERTTTLCQPGDTLVIQPDGKARLKRARK